MLHDDMRLNAVVDLVVDIELAIGALYQVFADRFPTSAPLWLTLADEEVRHADLARELQLCIQEGQLTANPGRFDPAAMTAFLGRIQDWTVRAQAGEVQEVQALEIAQAIEQTAVEQRYLEIAVDAPPPVQRILMILAEGTEAHHERIRQVRALHG